MSKLVDFDRLSEFEGPKESPGYLLWRVSTQWRSSIEQTLKPLGLTHPQFVILASLGWLTRNGINVVQVEIGRSAGLDPNTTSQILRGLETKKLIQRKQLSDERSKNPSLTALGSKILSQALPAVEKADKEYFKKLSAQKIRSLIEIFNIVISDI